MIGYMVNDVSQPTVSNRDHVANANRAWTEIAWTLKQKSGCKMYVFVYRLSCKLIRFVHVNHENQNKPIIKCATVKAQFMWWGHGIASQGPLSLHRVPAHFSPTRHHPAASAAPGTEEWRIKKKHGSNTIKTLVSKKYISYRYIYIFQWWVGICFSWSRIVFFWSGNGGGSKCSSSPLEGIKESYSRQK